MSWSAVVGSYGVSEATTARLVGSLQASEAAALAFCRLLETWQRGEPQPCTPGRRQAALRRAAERAETALADLQAPLERFLLELEGDAAEGRPWYGEPGAGEVVEWAGHGGRVRVHGEIWSARSEMVLSPGDSVRIIGLEGLTLNVKASN